MLSCTKPALSEKLTNTTVDAEDKSNKRDQTSLHEARVHRALQSFVHSVGLASHQHESYEHFLHVMLPEIIEEQSPVDVLNAEQKILHRVFLENVSFKKPAVVEANGFLRTLLPQEAIVRKSSYMFEVVLDVRHKVYQGPLHDMKLVKHVLYKDLLFARIPCMVGSSACHTHQNLDVMLRDRGIFIINGYEKVLITQSQLRPNYPYVFPMRGKHTHRLEVRCGHLNKLRSSSTVRIYITAEKTTSVPEIDVEIPFIHAPIPLLVVFRLLGVMTVQACLGYILDQSCSDRLRYRVQSILENDLSNTAHLSTDGLLGWIIDEIRERNARKHKHPHSQMQAQLDKSLSNRTLEEKRRRKTMQQIRKQLQGHRQTLGLLPNSGTGG